MMECIKAHRLMQVTEILIAIKSNHMQRKSTALQWGIQNDECFIFNCIKVHASHLSIFRCCMQKTPVSIPRLQLVSVPRVCHKPNHQVLPPMLKIFQDLSSVFNSRRMSVNAVVNVFLSGQALEQGYLFQFQILLLLQLNYNCCEMCKKLAA